MIICLDYGERYIGVAATDDDENISYRYGVIDQRAQDGIGGVLRIAKEEDVRIMLVGMPIGLRGNDTEQTHVTYEFIAKLREKVDDKKIIIREVDEMFTSKEAHRIVQAEGGKKEDEHAEAARLMLDAYLLNASDSGL